MLLSQTNLVVILVAIIIISVVMVCVIWWLIHDESPTTHKFSWHQLVKNSFHASLIDEEGVTWMIDIYYNESIDAPLYTVKGESKLIIQVPKGYGVKRYLAYIRTLEDLPVNFKCLINGIFEEGTLSRLRFTKSDLSLYREFKRHLLLKAFKY